MVLRKKHQKSILDTAIRDAQIAEITDLQNFIETQCAPLTEFNEKLIKKWIKQITVFNEHFTVELKSGLKFDINFRYIRILSKLQ